MTKQDILDYFSLIDFAYNESGRLESLSRMLDALLKEQEGIIDSLKSDLSETLDVVTGQKNVVRCKDCRWGDWSRNIKGEEMILCYNGDTGIEDGYLHEPNWFCAEGVKRDE